MNGHDPFAAGLLILALAPVELDALQVAISLVVLGFGLVVAPPLLALAALG